MSAPPRTDARTTPLAFARVASLPIHEALALYETADPLDAARALIAAQPAVRNALYVASPSLAAAVDDWIAGRPLRNPKTPLRALCYVLRMAARCTPFGLFAGVGEVQTGAETTLALDTASAAHRSHTRADMGALAAWIADLERGPLRERIGYRTNDCAFVRGDRLHVTNLTLTNATLRDGERGREQRDVSLRNTKAVAFVRDRCRRERTYGAIVDALADAFGAPRDDAARLFDRLIEAGVVISTLQPSPVGDPLAYLTARLAALGAVDGALARALAAAAHVDAVPVAAQTVADFARAQEAFAALAPDARTTAMQVDLHVPLSGTLGIQVLSDAEAYVDLALRCGPTARMRRYRERFIARYEGTDRMVPLLELVDAAHGLGAPDAIELDEADDRERQAQLMHLFSDAARAGSEEIELDDALLERVFPRRTGGEQPRLVEVGFELAADSPAALARGEYDFVGSLMADGPARLAGRFLGMLGPQAIEHVRAVAARTERDDDVHAEFAFAPTDARAYNLVMRPQIYRHDVRAGIGEPAHADTLAPDDLWVGLEDDRFFLWSRSRGVRVSPRETHVFATAMQAPNLCRLLAMIARDGVRVPGFPLGAANALTYLPRVRRGRLVLQPRRWRFPRALAECEFASLRARWDLPRYVYLCDFDQRLLLDLDAPISALLIADQLAASNSADAIFAEALPAPAQTWLPGVDGAHAAEFIVDVLVTEAAGAESARRTRVPDCAAVRPQFGPGSDWTYLKIYLGEQAADEALIGTVAPLVAELRDAGAIDRWFFLRYGDPDYHLRIRLHAARGTDAAHVREQAIAALEARLRAGTIARYALDTYMPEFERYGGALGVAAAERFFSLDSAACLAILADGIRDTDARVEHATAAFDGWIRASATADAHAIAAFAQAAKRKLSTRDREALRRIAAQPRTAPADDVLAGVLDGEGAANRLSALVHMHCNRLGLRDGAELRVCALLRALALGRSARVIAAV